MSYDEPEEDRGRDRQRDSPMRYDDDYKRDREDGEAEEDDDDVEVDDDGMDAMQAMMGFGSFASTKDTKVAGNNAGAVRKAKRTEYRQYMNRQGGFNRPLSPSR